MAWDTGANYPIVTAHQTINDSYIVPIVGTKFIRTRTIVTTKYVGMTQTAAENYVDTHVNDTNVVDAHTERMNDAGAYAAVITTDAQVAWSIET